MRPSLTGIASLCLIFAFTLGCVSDVEPVPQDTPIDNPDPTVPTDPTDPTDPVDPTDPSPDECYSTLEFFQKKIYAPVLSMQCASCHNTQGVANYTKFVLQTPNITGYLAHNYEVTRNVAAYEYEGQSILLAKPTLGMQHAGGKIIDPESETFENFQRLVKEFKEPVICDESEDNGEFFNDIELLSPLETFRKASLLMAGRSPTIDEETYIAVGGEKAMLEVLDELLREETFYDWVKLLYNDKFLTDKYVPGNEAADLYNMQDYPDIRWYDPPNNNNNNNMDPKEYPVTGYFKQQGQMHANRALAQEPLELIVHIIRNDLPFTEVVTADYTVVTPYSAMSLGVLDKVNFDDPVDPYEFKAVQLPGIPHAGVLTSPMWLNRFPTTATNRNRHRSRVFYDFFLATDVMKLAERPIDPTNIEEHNPTMFNPNCNVCHNNIDPIAGAFQNWDEQGSYRPPEEGWFAEMLPAGFGDETIPYEERFTALNWLGHRVAEDPRFATGIVRIVYQGLLGQPVLGIPGYAEEVDSDMVIAPEVLEAQTTAYETQQAYLQELAKKFAENDFNFRDMVKELVLSPYFRANGLTEDPSELREVELESLGSARFVTPEMLHRKIVAVTGFPWRIGAFGADYLLNSNQYRIFFGGIDSDNVTKRITDPNGFMVSVADRMANDLACTSVSRDFTLKKLDRHLFPFVETSYMAVDQNGFPVPKATEAIKENIRYLHWHLLGENVLRSSKEVANTHALYVETMEEGRKGIKEGTIPVALPANCAATTDWWTGVALPAEQQIVNDPDYVIRSWMAVLTYLFSDYKFLYE